MLYLFTVSLGEASVETIIRVCGHLLEERFWRSHGGDQMRVACSRYVEDLSRGHFPIPSALVDRWLNGLSRECLSSADSNVQQAAVPDRPGVGVVGVHINQFVLAHVVYCTMYTAVPTFWSTD